VLTNVSKQQLRKAKDAITRVLGWLPVRKPEVFIPAKTASCPLFAFLGPTIDRPLNKPNMTCLRGTSRYPADLLVSGKDHRNHPYRSAAASLLTRGRVPECLLERLGDFKLRQVAETIQLDTRKWFNGRIAVSQQGGAKARVFAMPNAWVQFYTKPYADYLFQVIHKIEDNWTQLPGVSAVFDQMRGVHRTIAMLVSNRSCTSVDLSSATDRFPLFPQIEVCKVLRIPEFGDALIQLTKDWEGLDGEVWNWSVGQPMGLNGSFPLFHLTHFFLLAGMAMKYWEPGDDPLFAVLGDDVVIYHDELLEDYFDWLATFEVPVTRDKSYTGSVVEFAGFVITKSRDQWTAFRPYKGENGISSVMNLLHAVGKPIGSWGKYWSTAFEGYQATALQRDYDLTPYVNEEATAGSDRLDSVYLGAEMNGLLAAPDSLVKLLSDPTILNQLPDAWVESRTGILQESRVSTRRNPMSKTEPSVFEPAVIKRVENNLRFKQKAFGEDPLIVNYKQQAYAPPDQLSPPHKQDFDSYVRMWQDFGPPGMSMEKILRYWNRNW